MSRGPLFDHYVILILTRFRWVFDANSVVKLLMKENTIYMLSLSLSLSS